jgi:2'-5' RNA ligase
MDWPSYHLWLKPEGASFERYSGAIARLARELGGPLFEPHVTLTSELPGTEPELLQRSAALAGKLRAFEIVLEAVDFGSEYFRCVYARARPTPALAHARELARRAYAQSDADFMPHLSLAYGDYPAARKRAAASVLPENLLGTFTVQALSLIRSGSPDPASWEEIATPRLLPA